MIDEILIKNLFLLMTFIILNVSMFTISSSSGFLDLASCLINFL